MPAAQASRFQGAGSVSSAAAPAAAKTNDRIEIPSAREAGAHGGGGEETRPAGGAARQRAARFGMFMLFVHSERSGRGIVKETFVICHQACSPAP